MTPPTANPTGRVLVAEDDQRLRESLARVLTFEGYDVALAADDAAALNLIEASEPDVVVLDVMMPNVDGLEVCRTMRARGNHTPVLMLTARHEVSDRLAGHDAGACDYPAEPYSADALPARLIALRARTSVPV